MVATRLDTSRSFDSSATAVAFPLGGIGTGNVSLGARGELRDWEIFNASAKGNTFPNTFFAIRTQLPGQKPDTRVIEGPLQPPHSLSHGYHPAFNAGLPRLARATLRGEYPLVNIRFEDPDLPLDIELEAFTPLIPLNPQDSGIPCAIFTYHLTNKTDQPVALTLAGSLINPIGGIQFDQYGNIAPNKKGRSLNQFQDESHLRGVSLRAEGIEVGDLDYGSLSLTTTHPQVTVKAAWQRGGWWDYLREFWDDLVDDGLFTDLGYTTSPADGRPDTCSLGLVDTLPAGERREYRFVLTWFIPNRVNSWDARSNKVIRNHYATRFGDAWDVARYVVDQLPRLERETRAFHNALFSSSLPDYVLDAVSANIVSVRSNTCFWLEDGRFYGWEGCFDQGGCCPGSCTHVWSYAYTVAYLFPSLEREMRRIEFVVETDDTGYMAFRNFQSFGEQFIWQWGNQQPEAAVDGQMGSVLRVYREWLLSADREWLQRVWPGVKRAMDFASIHWDMDHDYVLDGKQHNTYDIEFYGPNPLSSIYFLAALRATEALAGVMNEPEVAQRCRSAFEQGSQRLDSLLWNGEFYIQHLENINQHPYQHGVGCLSDQLLGQLHAEILGLGDLLPREHLHQAIKSIFDHNFRQNFGRHVNCQRTFVLNDEAGLLACSWPNGGQPQFPFPYSDEVWPGMEYHVAAHLIYEGWLDEGLQVVKAAQDRHDGVRRNPWNEVECGHHYSRSMSSWALLLALSGFHCDVERGEFAFHPARQNDSFFWSSGDGWGTAEVSETQAEIRLLYGKLRLKRLTLPIQSAQRVTVDGVPLEFEHQDGALVFCNPLRLAEGQILGIE